MTLSCCGVARGRWLLKQITGSPSTGQYWLSCCVVDVQHARITGLLSSMRPVMPSPLKQKISIWATNSICWCYIFNAAAASVECRAQGRESDSSAQCGSGVFFLVKAARQSCECAPHASSQSSGITQREKKSKREKEREREAEREGEDSQELHGEGRWFYLHLQPSSHK